MTDLQSLTNDQLLAQLEAKGGELSRLIEYESSEREHIKREYTALCAEWTRRNQITKGE